MHELPFPRLSLCHRPTPLEPLPRLGEYLDAGPRIFVKRDDCTGLAGGGNKVRKLEFLVADALRQQADTLVTTGGVQSNHARQTAAAAAKCGLACELVLPQIVERYDEQYQHNGNVLLDELLGATLHVMADRASADAKIKELKARAGTYFIPTGGSSPLGALGYFEAARECLAQCAQLGIEPTHHVVVTGSCGTHAGLLAGLIAAGVPHHVIGISVAHPSAHATQTLSALLGETAELIGQSAADWSERIDVRDDWLGPGYGVLTAAAREAIRLVARREGLLLDPVYTGKAMAGLIDLVRRGELKATDTVIFWHTGGSPGLFAYANGLTQSQRGD